MDKQAYSYKLFGLEAFTLLLALLFLAPFYFLLSNSFKTFSALLTDTAGLPEKLDFSNYIHAWEVLDFPRALGNSIFISLIGVLLMVVFSSMAAYRMVRKPNRFNRLLFSLFVAAMVVPFQAIMIPLVQVGNQLHFMNSYLGIILCYVGLGVSFSLFLYHGFIRSIPLEIEEAAVIDGCTPYGVFWRIIFPLLKPMTVTVIVLQGLMIWNDFLLPLLFIQEQSMQTVQLAINALFGQYTKQWDLALAALVMSIIPVVAFFLALQRHVIEGITAGAVKG